MKVITFVSSVFICLLLLRRVGLSWPQRIAVSNKWHLWGILGLCI